MIPPDSYAIGQLGGDRIPGFGRLLDLMPAG